MTDQSVVPGLMYKLQKVTDDHWYDVESVFLKDEDKKTQIVDLLAKYWWYIMAVGKSIRGKEEELYENIAKGLKKSQEDVLYAFTKDAEKAVVEDHSPDIAVGKSWLVDYFPCKVDLMLLQWLTTPPRRSC